jgi:hypothetical protein
MSNDKNRNKQIQQDRAKKMGKIYQDQIEDPFSNLNNKKIIPIKQPPNTNKKSK